MCKNSTIQTKVFFLVDLDFNEKGFFYFRCRGPKRILIQLCFVFDMKINHVVIKFDKIPTFYQYKYTFTIQIGPSSFKQGNSNLIFFSFKTGLYILELLLVDELLSGLFEFGKRLNLSCILEGPIPKSRIVPIGLTFPFQEKCERILSEDTMVNECGKKKFNLLRHNYFLPFHTSS